MAQYRLTGSADDVAKATLDEGQWRAGLYDVRNFVGHKSYGVSSRVVSLAGVLCLAGLGPGSGLSLSKYFVPISDLHIKLFYNIRSNVFFFHDVHLFSSQQ